MPLAWRTVTGATQLFKLLPGVRVETPGVLTGTETIYLPRNLNINTACFARFRFYAKLVKHILLFKNPAIVIKVNRWGELLEYASHNVLLPSLLSITVETYWPESTSHYAWIALFSSPSVRRIEMRPLKQSPFLLTLNNGYLRSKLSLPVEVHVNGQTARSGLEQSNTSEI
ncbi:unnamed protein product [Rhizoctonia solani]|uniref:Uncharacterized protein n=1 Tax=Rhizoctonia solani TaxID=456999 RepID=A0A8H3C830_9AGAM|nr:unnamed protein product [Rhizoctonia solani]